MGIPPKMAKVVYHLSGKDNKDHIIQGIVHLVTYHHFEMIHYCREISHADRKSQYLKKTAKITLISQKLDLKPHFPLDLFFLAE
ncbi:hypothetical protein [Vibrio campbellii]|uniref:hypothetical protein n=1 Tax=Vibrio campbellii TaxID=680 RepID=UPI004057C6D1